mgnify:CR=1 FL=1
MPSSADIIAQHLARAGIRHAWGIPGGEVLALVDAIERQGIEFNLVKHENAGGFMAEGCYHASGAPGLLVATVGPGVANAINVIANAQQDRVPMIFLTGCVDAQEAIRYTHQVFDHQAVLRPITKASLRAVDGAIEETIDKALGIALDEPPGPVHVDVPISVATRVQPERNPPLRCRPQYGVLDDVAVAEVSRQLSTARRPLALAGLGVLQQGAERELKEFLLAGNIPLVTSYKAKGILPEDHALSLGASGLSPKSESILLPLVAEADLILLFGYDPIEMRAGWRNAWSEQCTIMEFSTLPNTHYMHQASHHYYTNLKYALPQLQAQLSGAPAWADDAALATCRKAHRDAFTRDQAWGPHAIIETARQSLPENTVASVDTGAHRILLSQKWQCPQPRTLLQSSGLCTMGVAIPIALGYKRAKPGVPVVAFTGDAGLEMVMGDLATVRDSGLPLIIVVFVDESLALIELKQRAMEYPNAGVDFAHTDFVAIARAYGFHGAWVDDAPTLEQEIDAALERERTSLLACRFPRKAYDDAF